MRARAAAMRRARAAAMRRARAVWRESGTVGSLEELPPLDAQRVEREGHREEGDRGGAGVGEEPGGGEGGAVSLIEGAPLVEALLCGVRAP
jgi:hypothetical protein